MVKNELTSSYEANLIATSPRIFDRDISRRLTTEINHSFVWISFVRLNASLTLNRALEMVFQLFWHCITKNVATCDNHKKHSSAKTK